MPFGLVHALFFTPIIDNNPQLRHKYIKIRLNFSSSVFKSSTSCWICLFRQFLTARIRTSQVVPSPRTPSPTPPTQSGNARSDGSYSSFVIRHGARGQSVPAESRSCRHRQTRRATQPRGSQSILEDPLRNNGLTLSLCGNSQGCASTIKALFSILCPVRRSPRNGSS